jgi:hypothetical protein
VPATNESELIAAGLRPEDFQDEAIEVWPENERAVSLLSLMATQWRVGFNGPTGLDYGVMFTIMTRMGLSTVEYDYLFHDMRVAEAEALAAMTTKD